MLDNWVSAIAWGVAVLSMIAATILTIRLRVPARRDQHLRGVARIAFLAAVGFLSFAVAYWSAGDVQPAIATALGAIVVLAVGLVSRHVAASE